MPTTLIDSAIFTDIFSTDSMRRVWSDENRTQKYLDIEAALARVPRHADRAALERMMDPSNYLGQAGPMIDRVLATHASTT
jgi:adenylosuccinate lyase